MTCASRSIQPCLPITRCSRSLRYYLLAVRPARLLVENGAVGGDDLGTGSTWSSHSHGDCALVGSHECRLQVWWLDESTYAQPEWVLRCDENLMSLLPPRRSYCERGEGPWLLRYLHQEDDDDASSLYVEEDDDNNEGQLDWRSDIEDGAAGCINADDHDTDEWAKNSYQGSEQIAFLGFHPSFQGGCLLASFRPKRDRLSFRLLKDSGHGRVIRRSAQLF